MSVPLYLKIKQLTSGEPCFDVTSEKSIEFNDTKYDFEKIYQSNETQYPELISAHNTCVVLMGPTGGGKTTMMRQLVNAKLKSFDDEPVFVSSFEITNNKFLIDLMDPTSGKIPFSLINNFENKLKRKKASHDIIKDVFRQRSSKATEFNANSSRSCLVMTFFHHNSRTTFVDLMGNEKNSKFSSNIFANANMSSITQQMVNKQKDVRSHNLVTNYIFKNKDLKVVLNLDQDGDASLIKSTLTNIADIVKTFKLSTTPTVETKARRTPTYTLPTVSSIRGSPKKVIRKVSPVESKPAQLARPRTAVDRKYIVKKPPVPTRGPSKEAKIIEALKKEQIIAKQKYADSISDIKTEIGYFKQETSQMVNAYQELRLKLDSLAKINHEKEEAIAAAQEENAKIIEELSQMEKRVTEYEQVKARHQEETEGLDAELAKLKNELQDSLQTVSELNSLKASHESEMELKKEEGRKLMERIRLLNIELDEHKKLLASNDFDIRELREKIDSQSLLLAQKEQEFVELKNSRDELVDKNRALESELESAKLSLEKATAGSNEVSGEVKRLSELLATKEADLEKLQTLEQELSLLKQRQQAESESASSQLSTLKADIAAKQIKLDHLRNTETTLNQLVQQLQAEKQELESKVDELTLSNAELQKQINAASTDNGRSAELERELAEVKNQVVSLSQDLQDETSLNSHLKSDLEAAITKQQGLQSELADFKSNLQQRLNENEDLTNKLASKSQQLTTKIQTITQLETKISDLKRTHEMVIAEKDAEIKKLKSSPTKLGLSDEYNNAHLFSERSSPFGLFNPNDIYNDSVVEHTINLNQVNPPSNGLNKSDRKSPDRKSLHKKSHHKSSRSSTPKHTPTKNVLQPSNQFSSGPHSSGGKIKKKSGSNKSSPLKSIKA